MPILFRVVCILVVMSSGLIIGVIVGYFLVLMVIARLTGRSGSNNEFFKGDRSSSWYLVAFGMIGASLSGVTFVSATGGVHGGKFGYFQMVLGFAIGYVLIAYILLPVYYRLGLTSIYEYLKHRFGMYSYRTGAFYFLISRLAGSSVRLLLVAETLQIFLFDQWDVPFWVTISLSVALIWVYTQRSGIRTIVFTDTLQTAFMIIGAGMAFYLVCDAMDLSVFQMTNKVTSSDMGQIWFTEDVNGKGYWLKQIIAGALVAFCMTGLDQDMMQKNLTCRTLKDSQKNMMSFTVVLVAVNFLFLVLGGALVFYAQSEQLPIEQVDGIYPADQLFPYVALEGDLGLAAGIFFLLGLVAAAYSSADSALTALTTSVCVDFYDVENKDEATGLKLRKKVHVVMSVLIVISALLVHEFIDASALGRVFFLASLTYGPLLGLFVFGLVSKRELTKDKPVVIICILAPVISYFIGMKSPEWFGGYEIGNELLGVNGLITILGLIMISKPTQTSNEPIQAQIPE